MKNCIHYFLLIFVLTLCQLSLNAQSRKNIIVQFNAGVTQVQIDALRRRCNALAVESFQTCDDARTICLWNIGEQSPVAVIGTIRSEQTVNSCGLNEDVTQELPIRADNYEGQAYSTYPNLSDRLLALVYGDNCRPNSGATNTLVDIVDSGIADGDLRLNNRHKLANNGGNLFNQVSGYNYVTRTAEPQDGNSHGTHVAGIAQMVYKKYATPVQLVISRTQDNNGNGRLFDVLKAIAKGMCNEQIFNLSLNYRSEKNINPQPQTDPLFQLMRYAGDKFGCLIVVGAGNDKINFTLESTLPNSFPAEFELNNLICVYSVDNSGNLSSFSNFGNPSQTAETLRIGAPGEKVFSSVLNAQWGFKSGTSMATPYVTGVAALLASFRTAKFNYKPIVEIIKSAKVQVGNSRITNKPTEMIDICRVLNQVRARQVQFLVMPKPTVAQQKTIVAFPNPSTGLTQITFDATQTEDATLNLINTQGQQIQTKSMPVQEGQNIETIDLQGLPIGMYQVILRFGNAIKMVKIMKN